MFLLFLLSLFKQHKIINLKYVNWLNVFMKKALEYSPVFQMQRMCDDVTFTGSDVWRYVCVCEHVKRKPFVGTVLYVRCCFAMRNLHFAIDFTFLCMIFVFIYYYCKTIWETKNENQLNKFSILRIWKENAIDCVLCGKNREISIILNMIRVIIFSVCLPDMLIF